MTEDKSLNDEVRAFREKYLAEHPTLTAVVDGAIEVYDLNQDGTVHYVYPIPLADLRGGLGTAFWVRQLADKTWITKDHLSSFASDVIAHFGLK